MRKYYKRCAKCARFCGSEVVKFQRSGDQYHIFINERGFVTETKDCAKCGCVSPEGTG